MMKLQKKKLRILYKISIETRELHTFASIASLATAAEVEELSYFYIKNLHTMSPKHIEAIRKKLRVRCVHMY